MGLFRQRSLNDDPSDDDANPTDPGHEQRAWFKRRFVVWTALSILVVIVAFGGWLGLRAQAAKNSLEQARHSAQQSKEALLHGNARDATRFAADAQSHAQAARDATHSVPWNIAAVIPWLGSPFKSGQRISDVVLGLTAEVLKPTADAAMTVAPDQLLADNRLDVVALRREQPMLSTIATDAARLAADAKTIPDPLYLSAVEEARSQLQAQTSEIAQFLGNTAVAARLAPSLMGADGPRTYFMGFQTNAEARGTGGLLGGFGLLRFDNGRPTIDDLGTNTEIDKKSKFTPISLGPEFDNQYGFTNPSIDIRNSNQSPHFPYAAQIWKSIWSQQSGVNVDGVIAIDPVALSYILDATGPVTMPDGESITANNVVELTESTVYQRFPNNQAARKQYLQDVAAEVVKKITRPAESPRKLLDALGRAISERRISVWSSSAVDQKLLEETPLAHAVPNDPAPYAEFVVNNLAGNKLDYYLDRRIDYVADGCNHNTRITTATIRLTNTLLDPTALPDYVAGRLGFFPGLASDTPKGTMITSVRLLATTNARVISVLVNGERTRVYQAQERGHPTWEAQVTIPPGKTVELAFRLSEPTSPGEARVPVQPLIGSVTPTVSVPTCKG